MKMGPAVYVGERKRRFGSQTYSGLDCLTSNGLRERSSVFDALALMFKHSAIDGSKIALIGSAMTARPICKDIDRGCYPDPPPQSGHGAET
jgi:hypothetical protein